MSAVSGIGTFIMENKTPTTKSVARDFILGAILLMLIMQLLPDSTHKLLSYLISAAAIPAAAVASAAETVSSAPLGIVMETNEVEVKVGVPRF